MKVSHIGRYEKRDNTTRNTLVGAGVAAAGGAYVGHLIATPIRDGKFNDKFVHNVMTACAEDMDDVKYMDFAKQVNKMGAHPSAEDVKYVENYLTDNAKSLGIVNDVIENAGKKTVKFSINEYIENVKQGYKEALVDTSEALGKVYDASKKSFKKLDNNAADDLKVFSGIVKDTLGDLKAKNAWKFAGIGLLVGGVSSFIATKIAEKK